MNIKRIFVAIACTLTLGLVLAIAPTMNATASAPSASVESAPVETSWGSCEDYCYAEYRECLEQGGHPPWCEDDYYDCYMGCQ